MKKCSQCGLDKNLSEFSKDRSRVDGLNHRCKSCGVENSRKRNIENRGIELNPATEGFRQCNCCGSSLHITEFGTTKNTTDMRRATCKKCEYARELLNRKQRTESKSYAPVSEIKCPVCGEVKPVSEFHKSATSSTGYYGMCKTCKNQYTKTVAEKRREAFSKPLLDVKVCACCGVEKQSSEFYVARQSSTGLNSKCKACCLEYAAKHRHVYNNVKAHRRAKQLNATPKWLTKQHRQQIKQLYKKCKEMSVNGLIYHVDHIIPLVSDVVCGLHVPWNLQILESSENIRKSNRLIT